jgi:hypothetical protein
LVKKVGYEVNQEVTYQGFCTPLKAALLSSRISYVKSFARISC